MPTSVILGDLLLTFAPNLPCRNCSNIQLLNLSFCTNFTNKGLHYLSSGKGCQRLMYLDLSGCDQVSANFAFLLIDSKFDSLIVSQKKAEIA